MTAPRPIALELLTEAEAIRRIHGRDSDVRAWLRGLLGVRRRGPTGSVLYDWRAVVASMPLADEPPPEQERPNTRQSVTQQGRRRTLRAR